jgi:hypothetical protein
MKQTRILMLLFMAFVVGFTPSVTAQTDAALKANITKLRNQGLTGKRLQDMVLQRADGLMAANRPYHIDGFGDCWGYVNQVWNAILVDGSVHSEEFVNVDANRVNGSCAGRPSISKWANAWACAPPVNGGLRRVDFPNTDWVLITGTTVLYPGVPLATDQGHFGGPKWHCAIFVKNGQHYESTPATSPSGAALRTRDAGMKYYYKPLNDLLKAADLPISTGTYKISLKNGKALDAHQPTVNANGGIVQIWDPSGAANQQWYLTDVGGGKFTIRNAASNKVLDLNASNTANSAGITLWALNGATGSPNQQWFITSLGNGYFKIVPSLSPTRALAIYGNDINPNGIKVHLWDFLNGPEQSWQFTRL